MARSFLRPLWRRWRERGAKGRGGPRAGLDCGGPRGNDFRPLEAARFPENRIRECSRIITRALAAAWSSGIINPCASRRTISNASSAPSVSAFRWIYRRRTASFSRRRLKNIKVTAKYSSSLEYGAFLDPGQHRLSFGVESPLEFSLFFFQSLDTCV